MPRFRGDRCREWRKLTGVGQLRSGDSSGKTDGQIQAVEKVFALSNECATCIYNRIYDDSISADVRQAPMSQIPYSYGQMPQIGSVTGKDRRSGMTVKSTPMRRVSRIGLSRGNE